MAAGPCRIAYNSAFPPSKPWVGELRITSKHRVRTLLAVVGCALLLLAAAASPAAAEETGAVAGVVIYERDAERPWRLGRYYLQNGKDGPLAEAVVALAKRGLKGETNAEPQEIVVDQKDHLFTPEVVALRSGGRVKFLNSDGTLHNVRANHPLHSFNVTISPGGEYAETFARGGGIRRPYEIGCVYHSAMRAWVYVFDHPWFGVTAKEGTFQFDDVPPGEYPLQVVHPAGSLQRRQTVAVRAGETTEIELRLSPDDLSNSD